MEIRSNQPHLSEINNLYDFEKWYDAIENNKSYEDDPRFKKMISHHDQCKKLLNHLDSTLEHLDKLENEYHFVSNKTNALHHSCEVLLQQQHGLIVAAETINEKLTYFKELEPMSKKLSSPTMLVLNESLMAMLSRLDECVQYLNSKSNYRESGTYLKEFKHLQSQALLTIRNHVINTLQQTSQQVMPESTDSLSPNDSVFTLFYGKFQNNAHRIKTLMQQIEERINQSEMYKIYLDECHQCYFNVRHSLISPIFAMAIDDMVGSHKRNYCSLIKSSSTMLTHICKDEYQLFFQFFTVETHNLNDFLDKICLQLHDVLRPIVIHLEHLETLSEICSIIKNDLIGEHLLSGELVSFAKIMQRLLQDTQERLVYRANIYIETNIIGYVPASGDLAYPEKLLMMEQIAENIHPPLTRAESVCSVASDISIVTSDTNYETAKKQIYNKSPADIHGMWYPTVRRSLMCLSKLYRSLDKPTFQGLSQEVLAACILSLETAHSQITKNKTFFDGQLFLIKHLLIVREQIAPFHIEINLKEVSLDFSKTKTMAFELIQKRENLFLFTTNNALLKFFFEGGPQVTEKVVDSQKAVDNKIKNTCEEFIDKTSTLILGSFTEILNLAKAFSNSQELRTHAAFSIDNISKRLKDDLQKFESNLQMVQRSMALYLANRDTEAILFRPIKLKLQQKYEELKTFIKQNYNEVEQELLMLPPFETFNLI